MHREFDILFVGDAMVDISVKSHESEPGGANPSDMHISPGGLANIAVAAQGEGSKTGLLGRIGNDPFGDFLEDDLVRNGIANLLVRSNLQTGICINFISPDGERTMYTSRGANSLLSSRDLKEDVLVSSRMVFVSGFSMETSETAREITDIVRRTKQMEKRVVIGGGAANLIARRPEAFRDLVFKYADYFLLNEKEASVLAGCEDAGNAIRRLEPLCDCIIVTRGANGSTALANGEIRDFPSPRSEAVDSTGAGDVFAGVLLAGIRAGLPWFEAIPRAHLLASRSTERLGSR